MLFEMAEIIFSFMVAVVHIILTVSCCNGCVSETCCVTSGGDGRLTNLIGALMSRTTEPHQPTEGASVGQSGAGDGPLQQVSTYSPIAI